jgi:glycosyltransferase involved in cell wall biosynthesis
MSSLPAATAVGTSTAPPAPRFSVIIPTLGREAGLRAAVAALTVQTYPRERFEILVAFDGIPPSHELKSALAAAGVQTTQLDRRLGPGAARNAAAKLARGEILAFSEDDCVADPDWLTSAARRFDEDSGLDVLDGLTVKPGGAPVRRREGNFPLYLPTNLFVRQTRFVEVGGYHEGYFDSVSGVYFREDSDLGFSLEAAGASVARDRTARVTHPDEHPGLLDPLRWARRYVMDPLLSRRHPDRFRDRIEVLALGRFRVRRPFVLASAVYLVGLAMTVVGLVIGVAPIAVTGITVVIAALLAVWAKWKFDPRRLPIVPLVPFVLAHALAKGELRARRIAKP